MKPHQFWVLWATVVISAAVFWYSAYGRQPAPAPAGAVQRMSWAERDRALDEENAYTEHFIEKYLANVHWDSKGPRRQKGDREPSPGSGKPAQRARSGH